MEAVRWARFQKPLPADIPVKHFQQSRYQWKRVKWKEQELSEQDWSPSSGLVESSRRLESAIKVDAYLEELVSQGFTRVAEGSYPSGPTDYRQLSKVIKDYAESAFQGFQQALKDETLRGFALATDSDAMTLDARAITEEAIQNRSNDLSAEEVFFIVEEWPYGDERCVDHISSLNNAIDVLNAKREWHVPFDRQVDFEDHRTMFFEACISALEELRKLGPFPDQNQTDFLLLFEVMADERRGRETFLRLNPSRLLSAYERLG
ncbi:DUF4303 domain-containing protein [Hyphomonas sp. ND6WE1B]|uniref:DUF4303 domain-containing protein n=1 Tax=Hyphomonas sp. ND6WE1B TaxID=1848191 RepID=UPI0008076F66|nr:DUF4303 domain-containing protein [Hyphomonas sp. ND6WE1B]